MRGQKLASRNLKRARRGTITGRLVSGTNVHGRLVGTNKHGDPGTVERTSDDCGTKKHPGWLFSSGPVAETSGVTQDRPMKVT